MQVVRNIDIFEGELQVGSKWEDAYPSWNPFNL